MAEFANHPYIMQAEIRYGGMWRGGSEKRNFAGERVFESIPARIAIQQFESKFMNQTEMKERIKQLKLEIKELQQYVGAS